MFSKRTDLGREASQPSQTQPLSTSASASSPLARSVILPDLVIQGAVVARGEIELHGLVEGDVVARSIVVGPSATVLGDILGDRVSISGAVRGRVSGHQVHLGPDARYQGDIRRGLIAIDDGAQFEGSVQALSEEDKREIAQRLAVATPSEANASQREAAPRVAPEIAPGAALRPRAESPAPNAPLARPQPVRRPGVQDRRG